MAPANKQSADSGGISTPFGTRGITVFVSGLLGLYMHGGIYYPEMGYNFPPVRWDLVVVPKANVAVLCINRGDGAFG